VTSDEPWVHHCIPPTTQAGMRWKHPAFPRERERERERGREINACHSTGEAVTSVSWDAEGVIHDSLPQHTATTERLFAGRGLNFCREV
jgi:hypothetical protein